MKLRYKPVKNTINIRYLELSQFLDEHVDPIISTIIESNIFDKVLLII